MNNINMLFLSILSRLAMTMLLTLALSRNTHSAPTQHHLTIGVQGNTPTLMVTSSEIGITAQTMAFNKKPTKVLYAAKALREPETPKKSMKTKPNKNPALSSKKDKLHHMIKPQFKHDVKSANSDESNKTLEHHKAQEFDDLKGIAKEQAFPLETNETTTDEIAVSTTPENEQLYETNSPSTTTTNTSTLPPKQINETPLVSSITTHATTAAANTLHLEEEISTFLPPATTETPSSPTHFATTHSDDLNISPAVSTTLSPKDFSTLNNNDDTNTVAATPHTHILAPTQIAAGPPNDDVPQTHKTTQISSDTSTAETANEDDNDSRYTQESIAITDNENLLSTTIATNAFTSPTVTADISNPLETNTAQAATTKELLVLSLIATTTETIADDNDNNNKSNNNNNKSQEEQQQQPATATKNLHEDRDKPVASGATAEGKAQGDEQPIKQEYQKDNILIKSRQVFMSTTPETQQLKAYVDKTAVNNPLQSSNEQSTQAAILYAAENRIAPNKIQNVSNASKETENLTTTENEQSASSTYKADAEFATTTVRPEPTIEAATATATRTTTEKILKLIDLEKHVLKTIAELKQPSLLLATQHDNGHDGLKTTKKKQLFDKHYVEALLHQKQPDVQRQDAQDAAATKSSQAVLKGHMPLLKAAEHGSLGPILMQEKTFHVMHHQNDNNQKVQKHLKEDIDSQLRRGHFVELKAQPAVKENERNQDFHATDRMQADQPAEYLSQQNMQHIGHKENLVGGKEINLDAAEPKLFENNANGEYLGTQNRNNVNEDKAKLHQGKTNVELQRSSPVLGVADTTARTDLKFKLPDTRIPLENAPIADSTTLRKIPNKPIENMQQQPQALGKRQQPVGLSSKTTIESNSTIRQDKSFAAYKNSSQLMTNLKAKETEPETLKAVKLSKEIHRSNILKSTLDTLAEIDLEQHEHSTPDYSSKFSHNTNINETFANTKQENRRIFKAPDKALEHSASEELQLSANEAKPAAVLSSTVFQVIDATATNTPIMQAETLFTAPAKEKTQSAAEQQQIESKISDIQIEVYDSTIDSIVASTNFKDNEAKQQTSRQQDDENYLGKTTKPPIATIQQERFTQYVIDRAETSTPEPINYNAIKVANGKPEPAAIEIHINVSESFGNESEDLEFSYPQGEFANSQQNQKAGEESYDENKIADNIKLKIPANLNGNAKDIRNDEIMVVEIIDTETNTSVTSATGKNKMADELVISEVKHIYTTPPPPPPPPPYQTNFDRDSDTIFYISNTEVKVGESLPSAKSTNEERKLKLESQFFPANYMASTHPNLNGNNNNNNEDTNHHLYEEDIILSSNRNQADSLKIYRNNNEPSPPLDVTYVGESIIEVEQSPDAVATTTYAPDQIRGNAVVVATPSQTDVIIQPAILPEISIGVPVIGELPPQIELKEIDFMPNEAQLRRSGIYDDNDIDDNTITGGSNSHDAADIVGGNSNSNSNSNQHIDESSIQYGGDLIDESADGGFDGVEGSYPFGNPALVKKSFLSSSSSYSHPSAFLAKLQKQQQQQQQQPNHVADYAHLYVNYGVNNMRKDELTADVKDSGEMFLNGNVGNGNAHVANSEQNTTSFKDFLSKVSMSNATAPLVPANATQSERMSNATAFSVMEDANDLEDRNTENIINLVSLAIGLFIVILPVVVTCSMFWALRYLYKKYQSNLTDNAGYDDDLTERKVPLTDDGVEKGEFAHDTSSSPTNSHKETIQKYPDTSNKPSTTDSSVKFSSEKPLPNIETSSSVSNTNATLAANYPSALASQKKEALKLSLALSSPITQKYAKPLPTASSPPSNSTASEQTHYAHDDIFNEERDDDDVVMPGPNGSITKMTLENNLLIVETEERNDISRVARETKMDYNKDGVFVVEVARGIDSKTMPESPVTEGGEKMLSMFDTKQNNGGLVYKMANEKNCGNNEKVQIHSPPPENQDDGPRSLHQIEEVEEPINSPIRSDNKGEGNGLAYKANTGLSQSDLSTTSSSDSNKGYCYGNQELYVVEQKGYSPVARNSNVATKCDIKDLKDDDRNPGNDHYLKHSPDKMEDLNRDKEDAVETTKEAKDEETRTKSGESPEQRQNDQIQARSENNIVNESHIITLQNQECNSNPIVKKSIVSPSEQFDNKRKEGIEIPFKESNQTPDVSIPVEIEVHIIPAAMDDLTEDETLPSYQTTVPEEFGSKEHIESVPQPVAPTDVHEVLSHSADNEILAEEVNLNCSAIETNGLTEADSDNEAIEESVSSNTPEEKEMVKVENLSIEHTDTTNKNAVTEASGEQWEENRNRNAAKDQEGKEHFEKAKAETLNEEQTDTCNESPVKESSGNQLLEMENQDNEKLPEINTFNNSQETNAISHQTDIADVNGLIANPTPIADKAEFIENEEDLPKEMEPVLPHDENTDTEPRLQQLLNGHTDTPSKHNSLSEIENGYDSIMSLPEPPPTTDEQLNSDLSEQQLDSLPPPPPPEVFSLKDLPPPLTTNGNVDSPHSEESNSFYNTLPPPPPTTLEVTASAETTTTTNGKVHASPLTPPASPPAHFTNNLHAALCSQPIAVDVNGS